MIPALYRLLTLFAGRRLRATIMEPFDIARAQTLRHRKAVYIVTAVNGEVVYVGSVARTRSGVGQRIREHMCSASRQRTWHEVWLIPLTDDTSRDDVREIEGRVGRYLLDGVRRPRGTHPRVQGLNLHARPAPRSTC